MIDELNRLIGQQDLEGVRQLLVQGIDVNQLDSAGDPPIIEAARSGNSKITELLLSAGASPNAIEDYHLSSPLIVVAKGGYVEVARLLIQAGADVNYQNKLKVSPLSQAAEGKTQDHLEIICLLIEAGADVNAGPISTVLMSASTKGNPETVRKLIVFD